MRTLRKVHLYLGCFFAPLLLFYLSTGWYQTLHPNRNKGLGEKGDWVTSLRSVHVDQVYPSEQAVSYSPRLYRVLVVIMCVSLLLTLAIGVYLAFRTSRKQWPVWLSIALGFLIPILLLRLGQHR